MIKLKYECEKPIYYKPKKNLKETKRKSLTWGGCKNTRRSTTGFCIFLGQSIISWSAKRQDSVSRSSTEAEYRAMSETTSEITWISNLLRDLRIPQYRPTVLHCDNLSAVHLSVNPILHKRSKHFEIDYHYIRERVALRAIEIRHVPAAQQIADIFTKSLPRTAFFFLRNKLGVGLPPTTSLRGAIRPTQETSLCIKDRAGNIQSQRKGQTIRLITKPTKISPTTSLSTAATSRYATALSVVPKASE
ncbi:Retrovirus-related Pol polyprotein from transposon RE1 [Cardamine amara subsp. amara]|uniref:Retrovirus-related Pol polyprotein from transposon RE1 n=1 Tax=Cardamine amara subsp. amara TaxID=228776 RepID=A0ABD0ZNS9_CARAN